MRGKQWLCLFVFNFLSLSFAYSAPKNPGAIKFTNLDRCEAENEEGMEWTYSLNNVDADEWKSFDLDAKIIQPITREFTYTLGIDHFNHGDWEENVYNMEGNLCELLMQFVPKAWTKMTNQLVPKLDDPCVANEGTYKLRDLQVLAQDVAIPPVYGKVRASLKVYNGADENVLCVVALVDVAD